MWVTKVSIKTSVNSCLIFSFITYLNRCNTVSAFFVDKNVKFQSLPLPSFLTAIFGWNRKLEVIAKIKCRVKRANFKNAFSRAFIIYATFVTRFCCRWLCPLEHKMWLETDRNRTEFTAVRRRNFVWFWQCWYIAGSKVAPIGFSLSISRSDSALSIVPFW